MTREHYVKMAKIIAGEYAMARNDNERTIIENLAASTADMFAQDNPRFDRIRFYRACFDRDTLRAVQA